MDLLVLVYSIGSIIDLGTASATARPFLSVHASIGRWVHHVFSMAFDKSSQS